ncbi:unnamed protein product [Lasius platythorax]|uniref:CCHC-type domain-containing protein n=1 Tax=Lasius platythorax TaxID=488582 RepID=A0AAV2MWY8_9HYME
MPDEKNVSKFASSSQTRDALLKPAECGLRVEKITLARNNCVKVTARTPDIDKIKACTGLAEIGLKISEDIKSLPRLIIHGIPADMCPEDIKRDLMAQNLNGFHNDDVKIIYIYPLKQNRSTTSCVIEVSPAIRRALFNRGRIFLHFLACNFVDHVRILQCFRCLAFGHLARDCKAMPSCGHCSEPHESKDCKRKDQPPICCNCRGLSGAATSDIAHSALDAAKCPILGKKIKDKIVNTNYG